MDKENVVNSGNENKKYTKRAVFAFIFFVFIVISAIAFQADFAKKNQTQQEEESIIQRGDELQFGNLLSDLMNRANKNLPTEIVTETVTETVLKTIPVEVAPVVTEPILERENVIRANVVKRQRTVKAESTKYYSKEPNAAAANLLREMKTQAILGRPEVQGFEVKEEEKGSSNNVQIQAGQDGTIRAAGDVGQIPDFSAALAALQGQGAGNPDPAGIQQKENFLRGGSGGGSMTPQGYSENLPIPQQFRWELKAGTVIPGILMNGVDSSLPGMVRAQVTENVWDSSNGSHVLIPKGTMIIGVYNSDVRFGDRRVMMVWNRLIFPNGLTLNIAGSPGVDQGGYAGLTGRVNEHWDKMFLAALISTVFVGGAEVIYSDNSTTIQGNNNNAKSPRDIAAEELANEMLRLGGRITERMSNIPPVIRIKPGKRMGLFVQEDIVFPFPYPLKY